MKIRIEIEPEAETQLGELDLWWRMNRHDAATRVADEYERLLALLRERPDIGAPYTMGGVHDIRCVRLQRTPYKLYYHHAPGSDLVTIVAAWSSMRGRGPKLRRT